MDHRKNHSEIRGLLKINELSTLLKKLEKDFIKGKPSEGTCKEMIKRKKQKLMKLKMKIK